MKATQRKVWHIIGRGLNGWHATGDNVSSSGGDINPYTYWTGEKVAGYAAEAIEGAFVYDASKLTDNARKQFIKAVISGPMVKVTLSHDEGTSALSYVTLTTFRATLAAIDGIKIGKIVNGSVVWE